MLNVVIIGSTLNVVISVICVNLTITLITVVIASIYTRSCEIYNNFILLITHDLGTDLPRAGHLSVASAERAGHSLFGYGIVQISMTVWPAHCIGIGRSSATHTVTLILSKVQSPSDPLHKPKALLRVQERATEGASHLRSHLAGNPGRYDRRVHAHHAEWCIENGFRMGEACQPRIVHAHHVRVRAFARPKHRTHLVKRIL